MDKTVKVTKEDYKILDTIAKKENRFLKFILSCAIRNYGKAKKVIGQN